MDLGDDGWEFSNGGNGEWRWHRIVRNGEARIPSERAFALLEDCVEDARLCGFSGFDSVGMGYGFTANAEPLSAA